MTQKSCPSPRVIHTTIAFSTTPPLTGKSPKVIAVLKKLLTGHLRWLETVSLTRLATEMSRRFNLDWRGNSYALLRGVVTDLVEGTGILWSVCVEDDDGLPLRDFFVHAAGLDRIPSGDSAEDRIEFWQAEFERLCAAVRRDPVRETGPNESTKRSMPDRPLRR